MIKEIHFFEKPGCINNTKQKLLLATRGYKIISYDLFQYIWSESELRLYVEGTRVADRFNASSPRISSGQVDPYSFDEDSSLVALMADPGLIKRPLLRLGNKYGCGFDSKLAKELMNEVDVSHLLKCNQSDHKSQCTSNFTKM